MTRGGGAGKGEEGAGKVMGPLFPRLHVSDAARSGGPRAPPRNKMALYEQFTVPSSRFSSSASAGAGGGGGGHLAPSTSASQVYGYDRPMFQPFNMPSNLPAHSSKKINGNSMSRQISSTRNESGRLSSQTNNSVYAAASAAECTSQHKGKNVTKNSSGKKLANDDQFMVPSINSPRSPQHSTQEHAEFQQKLNTLCSSSPQRNPPAMSKSSAKCYSAVNKNLKRINVSDIRSASSPTAKERESAHTLKTVEAEEMSPIQISKERFGSNAAKVCLMRDKASNIHNFGKPHLGSTGHQGASMNGSSTKTQNRTSKDTVSCNPCTDLDITNRNSYIPEESLKEAGTKRKRSLGHHDAKPNDDLSDSVESIPEWEISPEQIVDAIGQKHFWKARRAIQNQQRIFAVQVFELHKLIRVQKSIAASPHVLIEGDPCLGTALLGKKNKLPDGNLKAQTLPITNKDAIHPSRDQSDLSKGNTEGNPPSPCHDDGLDGNHHGQVTTNEAFTSNATDTPTASGNKQNNWCVNPPQNQWLVPVMSPSEGLVYKPYNGPCPPAGSLLTPFYANLSPLSLPSTAYGVPMPHQQQYMAPPGAPAMPMNYFPPFTLPVMNPAAPASAVEQGSHAAASQPNGNVQSGISCNMSNPSGIWKFYASRDSEPQASSASSPSDRLQGGGSGPVSFFPAASVQQAQAQPSSGSRDKQSHVIRVVPHNSQTASASAARIFRSIQMERQQCDL
ncbi:hypothetical protein PR202_gb05783 [Eleusine coracana subsp. coracana]|uniref:Uncharacterized protein n=1 Tax=Eleusine coracana subsp. coracana TaxID=191504 RepID=A0AAV5E866_ELECO|nr:hypothetical protein QOZ80_1BG0071140 [Eleusine coracana subsp. coracana]GJN18608.1 hypothetical protein PR202_gb05783 [Eleusine coracana subsp. coracana]